MASTEHDFIARLDDFIIAYAKQLDGRGGAEYDDLHQEGRLAALMYYRSKPDLPDYMYASRAKARMINWCKYCKRGHNVVSYDEESFIESDD
mgnify:FL=1